MSSLAHARTEKAERAPSSKPRRRHPLYPASIWVLYIEDRPAGIFRTRKAAESAAKLRRNVQVTDDLAVKVRRFVDVEGE
jgi:hypothetical protein